MIFTAKLLSFSQKKKYLHYFKIFLFLMVFI